MTSDAEFSCDGSDGEDRIAVVGMAGRFPGAPDIRALWELSVAGGTGVVPTERAGTPGGVYGVLGGTDRFDAAFFGIPDHEAVLIDPQQRVFLEVVQHALDDAGVDPAATDVCTAVYAAAAPNVARNPATTPSGRYEWDLANGVDYLATRVAYRLGLRGEAITVQTACSSSLVAVHLAAQSLLSGQSDLAVAGGVAIPDDQTGYVVEEGMIASPTGACRPFDIAADGAVPGAGAAAVVLKRLPDALLAGNRVLAVILGSAINNDGATKVGFIAPSPTGQAEVIAMAHAVAGIDAATIGYFETHGTATALGDQVEIEGLRRALAASRDTDRPAAALGSLKANCGHLDRAAGVSGLIRAILVLEHGIVPPMAGCTRPNPDLDLAGAGLMLPVTAAAWPRPGPRRAGVSSFGVGGTNVHVVLEQAPDPAPDQRLIPERASLWPVSAHSPTSLQSWVADIDPTADPADVAAALARRRPRRWRSWKVQPGTDAAEGRTPIESIDDPQVVFAFPGQGEAFVDGIRELYDSEPVYRDTLDRCARTVRDLAGWDLRDGLYEPISSAARAARSVDMARFQPALFAVEWALARLWSSWGVRPAAVLGHSLGEVTAAACAGVLSEESALALVVQRSRLIESTPLGATLAVGMSAQDIAAFCTRGLELAADNGEELSTVTGPEDAVAALEVTLAERGVFRRRLNIRHSPHGSAMLPLAEQLTAAIGQLELSAPAIPIVSNVSGDWAGAEIAEPWYWGRQLSSPVRFREQLDRVAALSEAVVVVVGPGAGFARMVANELSGLVAGVVHPYGYQQDGWHATTRAQWLGAAGEAWAHGAHVDLDVLCPATGRHVTLPPTRFDHTVCLPRKAPVPVRSVGTDPPDRYADPGAWLTRTSWQPVTAPAGEDRAVQWLLPADEARRVWFAGLGQAARAVGREVLQPLVHLGDDEPRRPLDLLWWPDPNGEILAEAASIVAHRGGIRLWIVQSRSTALRHDEGGALAAVRVVPQEFPGTSANLVHISSVDATAEADTVVRLLATRLDGDVFDVKGDLASVQEHHQVWPGWSPRPLRAGGCYLVTGGLGRVGQALTTALSRVVPASFELVGRQSTAAVADTLAALRDRVEPRSQLNYTSVDVTDAAGLGRHLDRLRALHQRIDGVIHAAGVTDRSLFRLAADTGPDDLARLRAAKVEGTLALARTLEKTDADFVLLCSSLSVILGGVRFGAYVAANAWQSEFARRRHLDGDRRWLSVEWDAWLAPGRIRDNDLDAGPARYALDDDDGSEVLRRVLACDEPVIAVSTAPLAKRIAATRRELGAEPTSRLVLQGASADLASVKDTVRQVLAEVLHTVPKSDSTDLRTCGVESLATLQIVGRLREALGVRISLAGAMRALSVDGLATLALGPSTTQEEVHPELVVVHGRDGRVAFPTTPTQRRWLELLPEGYGGIDLVVDVGGPVESARLHAAVRSTIERHTGLRTLFARTAMSWVQTVGPVPEVPMRDLTGLPERERLDVVGAAAQTAHRSGFEVERRSPFHVELYRLAENRHALLIHAHHVLFDGWSSSLFLRDVAQTALGAAAPSAEPPLQYVDYALAQEKYLVGEAFRCERRYWQETFRGSRGPTRLEGRDGDRSAEEGGDMLPFDISTPIWRGLGDRAVDCATTRFVLLMSAYSMLLHEQSGEFDLVVGTTAAARPTVQTEQIVGVFVNPLPIRLRVNRDASVADYIQHVHDRLAGFHEHGYYPLEDLVAEVEPFIGMGLNDTFHCYLLYQNYWRPDETGLTFRPLPIAETHHKLMRDTEIVLTDHDDGGRGEFWWRPQRFSLGWARESVQRFVELLEQLANVESYPRQVCDLVRPLMTPSPAG